MADGMRDWRETEHPNGLKVVSYKDSEVLVRWTHPGETPANAEVVEMDVLRAIVEHHGGPSPYDDFDGIEPLPSVIVQAVRAGMPFTFAGIDFEPSR